MGLIELHQVAKTIKRRQLLHHVEASIERGSITTLEGINGSGKTLILKALLGLITVTGQVVVAGKTVIRMPDGRSRQFLSRSLYVGWRRHWRPI